MKETLKNYVNPWNIAVVVILALIYPLITAVQSLAFFENWSTNLVTLFLAVVVGLPISGIIMLNEKRYIRKAEIALAVRNEDARYYESEKLLKSITVNIKDSMLPKKLIEPKARLVKNRVVYLMGRDEFNAALGNLDWIASMTVRMKPLDENSSFIDIREECVALASISLSRLGEIFSAERKLAPLLARLPLLDERGRQIIEDAQVELALAKRVRRGGEL